MRFARNLGVAAIYLAMAAALALPASGQLLHKKKPAVPEAPDANSLAPDKVLFDRAQDAIKHGKYEVARLQLQALLNTYPDSAYLAQAKLAIGDSYFKEGGSGNLNLATDEYKSFITFFPFMPEAAYAQMQIAMVHYRRMDRSDRDHAEAQMAETEFQTFLQKYPDSPLVAVSTQRLREIQEVLADSDFRIASFYNSKKSYRAAASRLAEVVDRYPLYSNSDQALMMLGGIWERAPYATKEDEAMAASRRALAAQLYSRVVTDYPLSPLAARARERLTALGAPIPQPDAAELARMQKERQTPRERPSVIAKAEGIVHSGPNLSAAARFGDPNMDPPDENGGNVLRRTGPGMKVTGAATEGAPAADGTGTRQVTSLDGSTTVVSTPPAGTTGTTGTTESSNTTGSNPPAQPPPAATKAETTTSNNTGGSGSTSAPAAEPQGPPACPANAKKGATTMKDKDGKEVPCTPAGKESSSKKKTGIKKIIPFGGN
nr:outer membrane protein assembly factor BamD [Candidatus Acidoferrales bacterium]